MMRPFRFPLWAMLTLALGSCSPPKIKITLNTVNGRQVAELSQDRGLIFSDPRAPCVNRIDLNSSAGDRPLVWRIETKTEQCVYLDHFVIGAAPSGFVERVPLRSSLRGWIDFLVIGSGTGEAQFQLG